MGAGSSKLAEENKDQFYKEAFRKNLLDKILLNVEDIPPTINYIETEKFKYKQINIWEGDENEPIKPWLEKVIPPSRPLKEDLSLPSFSLRINHVFGFRTDSRKIAYFLNNDKILYSSGNIGIIQDLDDNSQTIFGGFENKDCHDSNITSMALINKDISMVATGQSGIKPKILIWSPNDPSVIYAKLEQPKGSKEVSCLAFDKTGHYLGSFGKDEENAFYIFDLRIKELYWIKPTIKIERKGIENSGFLLDMCFHPEIMELCVIGDGKIYFGNYKQRILYNKNLNRTPKKIKRFTTCCFVKKHIKDADDQPVVCLIGSEQGKFYIFEAEGDFGEDNRKYVKRKSKKISVGSIQIISYRYPRYKFVFITDSQCWVMMYSLDNFTCKDTFITDSIVKSIDTSVDNKLLMGCQNGDIKIKIYSEKFKYETILIKTHNRGSIGDVAYINDLKIVSVGEDNKIILYNLNSKKCDAFGNICSNFQFERNPLLGESECITYNKAYENIAFGTNGGKIHILADFKQLNNKKCTLQIKDKDTVLSDPIICLKYNDYGDRLLCMNKSGYICSFSLNYEIENVTNINKSNQNNENQIEENGQKNENQNNENNINVINDFIIKFDWDVKDKFIQTITNENNILYYSIEDDGIFEADEEDIKKTDFAKITCKFNYTIQGAYQGLTDPNFITSVSKANSKCLLAFGNNDGKMNLCNYPCISESVKVKKYNGHSGKIKVIYWNTDDSMLISIAENDRAIICWSLEDKTMPVKKQYH